MAEGKGSGGIGTGLAGLLQQWQVVVAAIAAVTALWFGFDEQRRKQLDVNRVAVAAAKASRDGEFLADAHNTLVEFRATYPEHAYCAALGYFVAEAGRRGAAGGDGAGVRIKPINDAVGAQIERIAAEGGLTISRIDALADAAAGDGSPDTERCPALRPPLGWRARFTMREDCRLLVETYAQAQCHVKAAERRTASVAAEIAAAAPPAEPVVVDAEPAAVDEGGGAVDREAETGRRPLVLVEPPGPDCGAAAPTVYLQYVREADRADAERMRAALAGAGWTAAAVDLVAGARTAGDVRFYWPDQEACARHLAKVLGGLTGTDAFATISLAGRYRNLPRNQIEAWLPAGSGSL